MSDGQIGAEGQLAEKRRFYGLVEDYLRWYTEIDPVGATELGIHSHDGRLADTSASAIAETAARYRRFDEQFNGFDPIDDTEWGIDIMLMRGLTHAAVRTYDKLRLPQRSPDFYAGEALYGPYSLLSKEFAPLTERLGHLAGRLAQVPRVLADAEKNLEQVPLLWVDIAAQAAAGGLALFEGLIPSVAAMVRTDDPIMARRIESANEQATAAIRRYIQFLDEDLRPRAGGDFAVGVEIWNDQVYYEHLLDADADSIEQVGRDLIASTQEALTAEAARLGGVQTGQGWREMLAELRTDHPSVDDLLPAYGRAMEATRQFVIDHDLMTLPGDEHLHIAETPAFVRPLYPFAGYVRSGPFESKQIGIFWVTPVDEVIDPEAAEIRLRGHPWPKIPIMAVHEGYPGHHLQLSRANSVGSLPRKLGDRLANLFIEGWAFYCEEMMEQEGFFTDRRSRLMRLSEQLWRACRIVIDVGLHCRGMSVEQAVAMLVNVAGLERPDAVAEVQRYSQSPTQPMSYLIGKLEIMRLHDDYKEVARLIGVPFEKKRFHDDLLSCGNLPPRLLRRHLGVPELT